MDKISKTSDTKAWTIEAGSPRYRYKKIRIVETEGGKRYVERLDGKEVYTNGEWMPFGYKPAKKIKRASGGTRF